MTRIKLGINPHERTLDPEPHSFRVGVHATHGEDPVEEEEEDETNSEYEYKNTNFDDWSDYQNNR
jgi:hypothetical protein